MKSLYCIKFKSSYIEKFYWLYPDGNNFSSVKVNNVKNTALYLELLNKIKPFDSPDDAYYFIRDFMNYSENDWYGLSEQMHLGTSYGLRTMRNVEFCLVDVTHEFKEIKKFKIKDIDYLYLLTNSYNLVLASDILTALKNGAS